jgi:hypothetical protein
MSRSFRLFSIIFVIAAGAGLFQLKYQVETKDRQLQALQRQLVEDQRAIRVLDAEWAYLNSPDYLQDLAVRYLGLRPTAPGQVLRDISLLPWRRSPGPVASPRTDFVLPSPRFKPLLEAGAEVQHTADSEPMIRASQPAIDTPAPDDSFVTLITAHEGVDDEGE